MRVNLRGGVWRNSEDEVLKAAVMKYGLNNWARVASLLSRKTARQCKARWYEYIDPAVKHTVWTLQEEERLLHLAKVFPSQWRTIAPLVGRAAHQCLHHYEALLDKAQGTERDPENDPRRLRPGDIDPAPETKPSKADAVDMEEDEIEMLTEARARLANTRGKKAKRKAREKQLDAAKRLAVLQKKRELKAAGITVGGGYKRRRKGDMYDYSTDIPFQIHQADGPFTPEPDRPPLSKEQMNISLQELETKRRDEERKKLENDDRRRLKRLREDNLPEALRIIDEMNNPLRKKNYSVLKMPVPEVKEEDILEILEMSQTTNAIGAGASGFFERGSTPFIGATPLTTTGLTGGISRGLGHNMGILTTTASALSTETPQQEVPTLQFQDKGVMEEQEDMDMEYLRNEMLLNRSTPVKLDLPRPIDIDQVVLPESDDPCTNLITHEMKALIFHDLQNHPMVANLAPPNPMQMVELKQDVTRTQFEKAGEEIEAEIKMIEAKYPYRGSQEFPEEYLDYTYHLNDLNEIHKHYKTLLASRSTNLAKAEKKNEKTARRVEVLLQGYIDKMVTQNETIVTLVDDIVDNRTKLTVLQAVYDKEVVSYDTRIKALRETYLKHIDPTS